MSTHLIPTLSLADFTGNDAIKRNAFVNALGKAYHEIGFVAIVDHPLTPEKIHQLYRVVQAFFALPDAIKMKYCIPGLSGQRGYTPKNQEHAKGSTTPDLKEFYHIGQTVVGENLDPQEYPPNVFPTEIPDFEPITLEVYRLLEQTGRILLQAIALHLGLEENYFDAKIFNGNSIMRAIHYYPIENPDSLPPDAVRAAAHEDINLITLLMGASAEGLQVLNRAGEWIPVNTDATGLVVNVGDMLQRLTNQQLISTTHRVVNPPRELMHTSRFSIPFFLHPRSETDLTCLPQCVSAGNPAKYSPITAGQYLDERLREIGLKS
jgi:isopenicillin N synthase-like dioxygenase